MPASDSRSTRPRSKWPRHLRWFAVRFVRIYLLLLILLMIFERRFIFHPLRYPNGDWNPPFLQFEDAWFQSDDGTKLHGWFCEHPQPRAIVLFAHGNAGNLSHRANVLGHLQSLGLSVMIFDYRGYGRSEGRPHEDGVLADARAAHNWLANRVGCEHQDIVLLGRSLGGAIAVDLAAESGARALVLENTFSSLPDVAAVHFPWVPVRWMLRTQFDSASKIGRYGGPLLQSHGTADEIVPFEFGQRLFEMAKGPKKFIEFPGHQHNDPMPGSYYSELIAFIDGLEVPVTGGESAAAE